MTGNRQNRSAAPGEKPVINEEFQDYSPAAEAWKWDFPERKSGQADKNAKPAKTAEPETSPDTRFKKGLRLFLTKRWEKALDEFLQVETKGASDEDRTEIAYYIGLCYTKLERFDDALLYFEQVITMSVSSLRVYQCRMIIAYVYIVTGRAQEAETELTNLQNSGLESVMLYNTLAYAAYAQKRYLGAVEFYEKALEIDKDNPTALNSLGYILADTGLDKLKGLRLCRKAVDKNPQNAAYLDSLGWASYQCGKIKDARKWLGQARDLAPQEAEIQKHCKIVGREVS